jgi:hypothetical protein
MGFASLIELVGAVLLSLSGGAAIVFALSKWLGGVWASRILENERASLAREQELLIRRRDVYKRLALSMRVFLRGSAPATPQQKEQFLAAYDEAALWAAEDVVIELGEFLDLQTKQAANPGSVSQSEHQTAFLRCMTSMRRDCGFSQTRYSHRIVAF